jgi:hypothetical protein
MMKTVYCFSFFIVSFLAGVWLPATAVAGEGTDSVRVIPAYTDTLAYITYLNDISSELIKKGEAEQATQYAGQALELAKLYGDQEGEAMALFHIGNAYSYKGNSKKALSHFIQSLSLKRVFKSKGLSEGLYYNMAVLFAKAKKYPLALKYFYKASAVKERKIARRKKRKEAAMDLQLADIAEAYSDTLADTMSLTLLYDDLFHVMPDENIVVDNDTIMLGYDNKNRPGPGTLYASDITDPFDDGRKAAAYGVMIHTKQPVTGKRKTFTGINTVGHMFITLTKFNTDSGYVSRTFGFYPDKDYLLSATPLLPVSTSVFKDDQEHDWDEIVAKFVSRRRFNRILRMVRQYSKSKYNLNKNNCTDFGLCVAAIAGIKINDTRGKWPLGGGNNPADAGQSILEGKIENMDEEQQLFVLPLPAEQQP